MNEANSATERPLTGSHHFIVAGISLTSIRKVLKPALPKKKQEATYLVVITAREGCIKIAIPGAAIDLPAITSGAFVAELPYPQFKFIVTDPFDDGALIRFELAPGLFCVNGIATHSPQILVQSDTAAPVEPQPPFAEASMPPRSREVCEVTPVLANPLDATVGLPLLAAYAHIRKYGIQPHTVSKTFAAQQVEVNQLLDKAHRILSPVGITRADLERLLDKKVGLA